MMGSEKGSVLVIVITGITIIAAIGAGLAAMVSSGARTGANHSLSVQALYAAESGLEWALSELINPNDPNDTWETACIDLINRNPTNIGQPFFAVTESALYPDPNDGTPENCEVTVTGWVGDKNNPLSSRRLNGSIPEDKIEGGGTEDIFNDLDGWGGGGNEVSYDDDIGRLEFDVTVKKNDDTVSVKLNRNGSSVIVDENSFDDNSDVYFFVKIYNWKKVASLKIGHNNSWEGNCDPISACQDSEEGDTFSVLLENISKDNVNDAQVSLEVVFQESGTVFFEEGCIAPTIDSCTKTASQNPVDSWNEG